MIRHSTPETHWVVCVENDEYAASLERGKLYHAIPDRAAAIDGFVRVIDESGEDYLYPARFFEPIRVSERIKRALTPLRRNSPARRNLAE